MGMSQKPPQKPRAMPQMLRSNTGRLMVTMAVGAAATVTAAAVAVVDVDVDERCCGRTVLLRTYAAVTAGVMSMLMMMMMMMM